MRKVIIITYWLCVTNIENYSIIKNQNIWGFSDKHRNQVHEIQNGDKLIFYQVQGRPKSVSPPCIRGISSVIGEIYRDESTLFKNSARQNQEETFPNRVEISVMKENKNPFSFKKLVPNLKFIKNKKRWGSYLMGRAMIKLNVEDYQFIVANVEN